MKDVDISSSAVYISEMKDVFIFFINSVLKRNQRHIQLAMYIEEMKAVFDFSLTVYERCIHFFMNIVHIRM